MALTPRADQATIAPRTLRLRHKIQIQNHQVTYDVWDKEYDFSLQVLIENGMLLRRYALSFITVDSDHQITKAIE